MRKTLLFILLSLVSRGHAELATLTVGSYSDGGEDCAGGLGAGCSLAALDVSEDLNSVHSYETGLVDLRSQFLAAASAPGTVTDIADLEDVGSDNSRYVEIKVALTGGSEEYDGCSAAILDDPDSDLSNIVTIVEGAVADVTAPTAPTCSIYLSNHQFLGRVKVEFTITGKDSAPDKTIQSLFEFTSHANDPDLEADENTNMRDLIVSYADGCASKGGYLIGDKDGDCAVGESVLSGSSANAGTVTLKLTGLFLDRRYKTVSQTGVNRLPQAQGDFTLTKDGFTLGAGYAAFNDDSKDVIDTSGGINVTPIDFEDRKASDAAAIVHTVAAADDEDGATTITDFSNRGQSLGGDGGDEPQVLLYGHDQGIDATFGAKAADANGLNKDDFDCDPAGDASTAGNCFAQFVLSTEASFTFGDLPHFQPSYIDCEICEARLGVTGFGSKVNLLVGLSGADLPSSSASAFDFKALDLVAKENKLLEPGQDYSLSDFFSAALSDNLLTQANGNALASLDDVLLDVDSGLTKTAEDALGVIADAIELDDKCATLKAGGLTLKALGPDIEAGYQALLESCKLQLPNNYYGTKQTLEYGDASVEITEIDNREINLINPSTNVETKLSLIGRTDVDAHRVATTISFQINKFTPNEVIPAGYANADENVKDQSITFRLAGDSNAFQGHVNTAAGGAECAGNSIYWKSTSSGARVYEEAITGESGPLGTCDGSSLSGVLTSATLDAAKCTATAGTYIDSENSVFSEGRCLGGTGYAAGELVAYESCKDAGGRWRIASVPDAVYTDSYTCTGSACDSVGYSLTCIEPAIQEEVLLRTSSVNGMKQSHNIQSTRKCVGQLDFQLEDQTPLQEFAIYRTRVACSRMSTETLEDNVNIKYEYASTLDLASDTLTVVATHSENVHGRATSHGTCTSAEGVETASLLADCGECLDAEGNVVDGDLAEGACLAPNTWTVDFKEEYEVSAALGTCSADNEIEPKVDCAVTFAADEGASTITGTSDDSGLETLIGCGTAAEDGDTYIISYEVAMQYTRSPIPGAIFSDELKFCDHQTLVATINRAATASVTSSSIEQAGLKRAVIVKDIGWVDDCAAGEFRLEVLIGVQDSDARLAEDAWTPTALTAAMVDASSSAQNPNNLAIVSDTVVVDAEKAEFKVSGACIAITECDSTGADSTTNGDSWQDFSSQFRTDLVVRGDFLEQSVDTQIQMTLNFQECPVDGAAITEGAVRVALATSCADAQNDVTGPQRIFSQSIAQPLADAHLTDASGADPAGLQYDCTAAYADDALTVDGYAFVGKADCSEAESDATLEGYNAECALLKPEADLAGTQQWSATSEVVTIIRYVTVGFNPPYEESRTVICESEAIGASADIAGLDAFNTDAAAGEALTCGTLLGTDLLTTKIPLMPLSKNPGDSFVVQYDVVLESGLVTRRLRASMPFKAVPKLKASSSEATGSSHAVRVISANDATPVDDGEHDHDDDGSHTHENDHDHDTGMIALIVILSVLGAGILGFALYYFACRKSDDSGDKSERESLVSGGSSYRQQRFKNLRY